MVSSEKVKCIIVDDEPLALKLLERHISQFPQLELLASCSNALDAFALISKTPVDLLFLDIQMPGLDGLSFARSLQQPPSIIFTTAYREYAVESYELNVLDYLLKPITMERFLKAITKYLAQQPELRPESAPHPPAEAQHIFVNTNRRYVKIAIEEILYVESLKDYIRIHTPAQEVITKDTLGDFEAKLPNCFLRTHRSFLVNSQKITAYTMQDIEIGKKEIPIGASYKKAVMAYLQTK